MKGFIIRGKSSASLIDFFLTSPMALYDCTLLSLCQQEFRVSTTHYFFVLTGIAHRDLKLENILLTRKNEPIVTDFGFARFVGRGAESQRARSRTFCGSYAYAAPEILSGTLEHAQIPKCSSVRWAGDRRCPRSPKSHSVSHDYYI